MKRFVCIFLAAGLLLLGACGKDAPITETTTTTVNITTTETVTTTEEAPTEPPYEFVPTSGESNGVRWRTLDWEDESNSEIKEWLENWQAERHNKNQQESSNEYPMGKKKTLRIETDPNGYSNTKFILRDNKSGKDEILLEGNGIDGEMVKEPRLYEVLDDRYFLFCWGGWEWTWDVAIYDIKEHKEISLNEGDMYRDLYDIRGNSMYLINYTPNDALFGPVSLHKVDLSRLPKSIKSVNMLENFTAAKEAGEIYACHLTTDERFFLIAEENGFYILDLQKEEVLFSMPLADTGIWQDPHRYLQHFVSRDDKTIYWRSQNFVNTMKGRGLMVEIKLP